MKIILSLCIVTLFISNSLGQNFILPLYSGEIPNYQPSNEKELWDTSDIVRIHKVQEPTVEVYLPSGKNNAHRAVVICPGGGYQYLAYDFEGSDVAKWFNSIGIAAVVLKYRLPYTKNNIIGYKSPLLDAQRAIRMTRFNAEKWRIDANKIGIMGFSAGGHLASTAGTKFDSGDKNAADKVDQLSCRPDFMLLIYPVISMQDGLTHQGSKRNLLGENPSKELVDLFSGELQVTKDTPPTFLVHSGDDGAVPTDNSLNFYKALHKNGIKAEMHIYPYGGHGYSLAVGQGYLSTWTDRCEEWLKNL